MKTNVMLSESTSSYSIHFNILSSKFIILTQILRLKGKLAFSKTKLALYMNFSMFSFAIWFCPGPLYEVSAIYLLFQTLYQHNRDLSKKIKARGSYQNASLWDYLIIIPTEEVPLNPQSQCQICCQFRMSKRCQQQQNRKVRTRFINNFILAWSLYCPEFWIFEDYFEKENLLFKTEKL